MQLMHRWAQKCLQVLGASMLVALSTGVHAQAQTLHSYALSQYYLGAGGQPPTLEDLAVLPDRYFRNEVAMRSFQSGALGGQDLIQLLAEERIRTVVCSGRRIETSGITATGEVRWFVRECYQDERLIEKKDRQGEWQIVASLGCLNLVRRVHEPTPVTKPPESKPGAGWGVFNTSPRVHHLPDLDLCNCTPIPGRTIHQPGSGLRPATNWNN